MTDDLVLATWGLFSATVLLVIATGIPAIEAIFRRKSERRAIFTTVVPDVYLLSSRWEGDVANLIRNPQLTANRLEYFHESVDRDLHLLAKLVENGPRISIEFLNELYVAKHLVTNVFDEIHSLQSRFEEGKAPPTSELDKASQSMTKYFVACHNTMKAAEKLLPNWTRNIRDETFWERFRRLGGEREIQAEKDLVDLRRNPPKGYGQGHLSSHTGARPKRPPPQP